MPIEFLTYQTECNNTLDQFIELYNNTDSAIDLNGLRIATRRASPAITQSVLGSPVSTRR